MPGDFATTEITAAAELAPSTGSWEATFGMKANKRRKSSLPLVMSELVLASWDTMARRTLLMLQNKCSPAEYRRMVREKLAAATESGLRLASSGGRASMTAVLAPWHRRATTNAKRLRKRT